MNNLLVLLLEVAGFIALCAAVAIAPTFIQLAVLGVVIITLAQRASNKN
jgi:uncharacterized membrane protein SpoIIM required for sporulation